MQQRFVHLRMHSEYSLVDGMIRLDPLMQALPLRGMSAIALTDHCNLFAAVKFFQAALSSGMKPIIGCDLLCHHQENPEKVFSLVLLCMNAEGYRNLTCLVSKAYQEGQYQGKPRVQFDWLASYHQGLIALSGGMRGDIGLALVAENDQHARALAQGYQALFPGRFYLEIQRTGREEETVYNERLLKLSSALHLPLVASNDVRFLDKQDFDAHEARVCIHEGTVLADLKRKKEYSAQQYLKSAAEMEALFADLPSALANTVEISKRCNLILELGQNYLPNFPIPDGSSAENYLSHLASIGLEQRLEQVMRLHPGRERGAYDERLILELKVINEMGFAGYFLIVADFIAWAKQNGVPVGPGRGSGAGSLVAYALQITDLDPLEYELLFERFLNPERVSMPDFDIDFCVEGRDRVIEYVAEKYGRQSVSQIITFGTMAAKAVVRDVGRVLGHPYPFVDRLAKLIPFELGITLSQALIQEPELARLYAEELEVKELFSLALKLEGLTRNAGKHAGGVVIAPSKLTDFTPIYCEEGSSSIVSQFDKDDVESVGLVKFDFLGLRTLTIIDWALAIINEQARLDGLPLVDISQIPMDDAQTFNLLKACQTTAIFQLESRGMKELVQRLQPDCFEDIIALVALFRPGPLQSGMVDDFIDRKHGVAAVNYPHPDLETILKPSYGVILYQEQVMQIAQVLANYTLGAADLLRRAMGKKKPEEMAKQREIFTQGATKRGVATETAKNIFDLMEKFAGYGFNKSHSAAYALVAYQTAWLKAHYPAAFMAAVLSAEMDNTDKIVVFREECQHMGLEILPPSINHSQYTFTVSKDSQIIYGLGAIKGLGESVIEGIVEERKLNGPFVDLFSLCQRLDLRKLNRRVLEALIKCGSLDEWGVERAILIASLDKALKMATQVQRNTLSGQYDLFTLLDEPQEKQPYLVVKPWAVEERLGYEREVLGFYLTGHPADQYRQEFASFITPIAALNPLRQKKASICGQLLSLRKIMTRQGKQLVIMKIDDATSALEVVVFSELFERFVDVLTVGVMLVVEGEPLEDNYNGGVKMNAKQLQTIEMARTEHARCLELKLSHLSRPSIAPLKALLKAHSGGCLVQLTYQNEEARGQLRLGREWQVNLNASLLSHLRSLLGETGFSIHY